LEKKEVSYTTLRSGQHGSLRTRSAGRGCRTAQRSRGGETRYRSKIEVLGDFLGAVDQARKKTRIVGLANLNQASFEKYLAFCLDLCLVETRPDGYHLTAKAAAALGALERIVAKSAEVDRAVGDLHRVLRNGQDPEDGGLTLRWVSRLAWTEVLASKLTGKVTIPGELRLSAAVAALAADPEDDWEPGPGSRGTGATSTRRSGEPAVGAGTRSSRTGSGRSGRGDR